MRHLLRLAQVGFVALLTHSACVPLTFSHDAAIDFEKYKRARVVVSLSDEAVYYGAANATAYLIGELKAGSGFEVVVSDPSASVDLTLNVRLSMVEQVRTTDDGLDFDYESQALYSALDSSGDTIDSGRTADSSGFPSEAIEDALDEVALRYLRPYRL